MTAAYAMRGGGSFSPIRGVVHRCYRNSTAASALVGQNDLNQSPPRDLVERCRDAFIAVTNAGADLFGRGRFLPPGRLFVKPNFTPDPGFAQHLPSACRDVVFVGRLAVEKGVNLLLDAWTHSSQGDARRELVITGDGPEAAKLRKMAERSRHPVRFPGNVDRSEVAGIVKRARFCVVPSIWPEIFGLVVIQAFAAGRPVLTFDVGGPGELVRHEDTGLKVPLGNVDALAQRNRDTLRRRQACRPAGNRAAKGLPEPFHARSERPGTAANLFVRQIPLPRLQRAPSPESASKHYVPRKA